MTAAVAKIETLLKDAMGLHAASIGSQSVERAVRARVAACGDSTLEAYWSRIRSSRSELQELIEAVVVPETWFSRDHEAFAELTRIAREEWRPSAPAAVRRLLSVPCSTGEEPYSMSMAMLDAGFTTDLFSIDAVDISERSLAAARRGVYGKYSFRSSDLAFRDRYFDAVDDGHRVNDAVRRAVRFRHGNVLADDWLANELPYDAIFCRNLLIYFDDATQRKTIAALRRALTDTGLLFVGPAEAGALLDQELVSARVPRAFAFRKGPPDVAQAPLHATPPRAQPAAPSHRAPPAMGTTAPPLFDAVPAPTCPDRMEEAFALADKGLLREAEALCDEQMRMHGPSAPAYYLLGLIHSAAGKVAAADRCYRKALFLDKNHHDALVHLALLLEQQGDAHGAKLLRARAQKV